MFVVHPILKHFSILLLILPFVYGEIYVGHWVLQMWELQTSSNLRTSLADVTAYGKSGDKWTIKYHFRVPGDSTVYAAQSINYRDTWMTITDQAYEAIVQQKGKIQVLYLPHDPWLNQPFGRDSTPLNEGLLSWSCMLPFNLVGLVLQRRVERAEQSQLAFAM
jgi:hypothetical protein